jgi:hypothetical protein
MSLLAMSLKLALVNIDLSIMAAANSKNGTIAALSTRNRRRKSLADVVLGARVRASHPIACDEGQVGLG